MRGDQMIYLIIALALVSAVTVWLGFLLWRAQKALKNAEGRCKSLQNERALRENLQNMLDSRNAEARRLRSRMHRLEDSMQAMEQQTSELNLNLFHESGLRILREKEDGARRMKMDLMEHQLDEANDKLKAARREAREHSARLNEVIDEQREKIDRLNEVIAGLNATIAEQQAQLEALNTPLPRRSGRRSRESLPNQVTIQDLMEE